MDIYSIEADVIKIPWLFKSQKNQEVSVTHLSSKQTVIRWLDNHRFGATSLSDIFPNVKLFLMQIIIIPTPAQVGGIAAAQVSIHRGWLGTQNTSTLNSTGSALNLTCCTYLCFWTLDSWILSTESSKMHMCAAVNIVIVIDISGVRQIIDLHCNYWVCSHVLSGKLRILIRWKKVCVPISYV